MFRNKWLQVIPAVAALAVAVAFVARAQEPSKTVTEKFKAKAGSAVESIKKGAANAEEAVREQFARARSGINRLGVETRVYSRIHWEKGLVTSKVELSSPREGVIALNGTVVDPKARAKAVELVTDTVGVTQVIDNLTVQTTTTGSTATPAAVRP